VKSFKNLLTFGVALFMAFSLPLALFAQGPGGGPHHGGGGNHHHGGGSGGGASDSTDVHTPPTVEEVFNHLLEEGLADCLSAVDATAFATVSELFDYVQANCDLPDFPGNGGPHSGGCGADSTGVHTPPTVEEVFNHLLEEGLADCLSAVDATAFATVSELFDYVQANCDLPDFPGNGGPHSGGCGADSTGVHTPPTVEEVFNHLLEEGLADCLSAVDATAFATVSELFDYVQANCDLPADTTSGPHHGGGHGGGHLGPHHGFHAHNHHHGRAAQQQGAQKTAIGAATLTWIIAPNPVTAQQLNINASEPIAQCRLFDSSGRLVATYNGGGSQYLQVLLDNVRKGIYIFQIQTTNGSINSQKVVIE